MRFSIFDWTHRESDDPYEQDPLGTCEATLAEIVANGGEGQVSTIHNLVATTIIYIIFSETYSQFDITLNNSYLFK